MSVPRLVVAAPASGHGKTSVATGLLQALARRGLVVSPHKVGPDYIDPGYHALAAGRPGRNLDPWLVGEERVVPLFLHGAAGADVAVVEGVMGLFDGAAGHAGFASTAHVAGLLRAPVLLVVDCTAQGRSVAALVHGFTTYDPSVRIGGVVLNRVGSDRHEQILREALEDTGVPVLGVLRRHDALITPSRHLGLVPAAERSVEAVATVRALGDVVASSLDLEAVLALARSAPDLPGDPWDPYDALAPGQDVHDRARGVGGAEARARGNEPWREHAGRAPVVALAGGRAFTFSYAETAELLAAAGADVVTVDPLADERLPAGTAALVIGGGFPEVYGQVLSDNVGLREDVARLAASGAPVAAECAGLLYLARELDGLPMCGVLDVEARMTPRLTLGYREAVATADSVLAAAGTRVRGHEFHRTAVTPPSAAPAWAWRGGTDGFVQEGVHASYLHLHWAGQPQMAARLVAAAQRSTVPA